MDTLLKTQAFKLKGRLYTLTVLVVQNADTLSFERQLHDVISQAPKLFQQTPIVLDCSAVSEEEFDLNYCCETMRNFGLIPVGVQGGNAYVEMKAKFQGLAILKASDSRDKEIEPLKEVKEIEVKEEVKEVEPLSPVLAKSKMIINPVRSGQQIVSKTDLVVASSVSPGAELLADGNIHVYGVLRGRALAGINGDKNARIFCQALDAELVSIAGVYRLSDSMEKIDGACQIYIQDDYLYIERL